MIAEGRNPIQMRPLALTCTSTIGSIMKCILRENREERPSFHDLRMTFEEILEGEPIRALDIERYKGSPTPQSHSVSPGRMVFLVPETNSNNLSHSASPIPIPARLIPQKNKANYSSTPNLNMKMSTSPSRPSQANARQLYGSRKVATSSKDLLEPPTKFHEDRRYSEEVRHLSASQNRIHVNSSSLLSASAHSLSSRLAKSHTDIHDEMMKEMQLYD
jgi:hypothetical protein